MVLHLLGKKSWNVYNQDNIERVRRDEAQARAKEEAEEQRMQEEDAARRTAILRGEQPPPLELLPPEISEDPSRRDSRRSDSKTLGRPRRRHRDEDDTDRDIRFAREDAETAAKAREVLPTSKINARNNSDAPLVDHAGHLQLIPVPGPHASRKAEKNAEFEAEKAEKRKREEDQHTMRFSNAAGYQKGLDKPWYSSTRQPDERGGTKEDGKVFDGQDKDVWGNEDPMRQERAKARIASNDPFAAMQMAQRQLKQSERDREQWQRQRNAEIEELKRAEVDQSPKERQRRKLDEDNDGLEGFSLDDCDKERRRDRDKERRRRHSHRRHRSRSRSRERHHNHRHRSRSPSKETRRHRRDFSERHRSRT